MKRFLLLSISALAVLFTACKPNEPATPGEQENALPSAFVKKHLIEEFTGQTCGYCPYGMDFVRDFMENDTNWILVMHHYGYAPDNLSVAGSDRITKKLNVSGAPNISIDRGSVTTADGAQTVFHPGYLSEGIKKSQFADSTYVGLQLVNTYDAATRLLTVKVTGAVVKDEHPQLFLTVLLKESGMVDAQADYMHTFEGWQEFRHICAVRAILGAPLGDSIHVDENHRFSDMYQVTIEEGWIPENCAVVAIVTEGFKPVVQVAQLPVVAGTQGGANIQHGGITPVPVPDYYPEPGEDKSPSSYFPKSTINLVTAQAWYESFPAYGLNYWTIMAYNTSASVIIDGTISVPFAYIYLITESDETSLPEGTFELNTSMMPGTVAAGYRDDEYFSISGSSFYFVSSSYFSQGYLVPIVQWLIADGTLTITDSGWTLDGHARNGTEIRLKGTQPISDKGRQSAPAKRNAALQGPKQITDFAGFTPRR